MTQQEQIDILCERDRKTRDYARGLAVSIHEKFYPENKKWIQEDDTIGLLMQIDNMVTGLTRIIPPRPKAEVFKRILSVREQIEDMESSNRVREMLNSGEPTIGKREAQSRAASYLSTMLGGQLEKSCNCYKCTKARGVDLRFWGQAVMVVCPVCGNKRCPKASDHELACTGSNAPGQKGSVYE